MRQIVVDFIRRRETMGKAKGKKKGSRRVRITKPLRITAYKVKVQLFDSLKYLDLRALSKVGRGVVEIGTAETRKGTITVVAHVRKGAIVALAPKGCADCFKKKGKKPSMTKLRAALHALDRAGLTKLGGPVLPMPVGNSTAALRIRLGSIIITDIDFHWFDVCISYIATDGSICVWCLFGPSYCVDVITGA
jgi:hypothetical protein